MISTILNLFQIIEPSLESNFVTTILKSGSPVFNQSAADYQDFELPLSDQDTLVFKILEYAGVNIREPGITSFAAQEESINDQKET